MKYLRKASLTSFLRFSQGLSREEAFLRINNILAQEIIYRMNKMKGNKGLFAIKVDLSKAYDKLSWEFIWRIFDEIKLPMHLTNIIMHGGD